MTDGLRAKLSGGTNDYLDLYYFVFMSLLYSAHYTEPLLLLANTQDPVTFDKPVLTLLQNDVSEPSEVAKIAVGLYANALDLYLDQASAAQDDAEWWAEVEQSNQLAALYLLQSMAFVSHP